MGVFYSNSSNLAIKLPIIPVAMNSLLRTPPAVSVLTPPAFVEVCKRALPVEYANIRATLDGIRNTDDVIGATKAQHTLIAKQAIDISNGLSLVAHMRKNKQDGKDVLPILHAGLGNLAALIEGHCSPEQQSVLMPGMASFQLDLSAVEILLSTISALEQDALHDLARAKVQRAFDDEVDPMDKVLQGFSRRTKSVTGESWIMNFYRGWHRRPLAMLVRGKSKTGVVVAQNEGQVRSNGLVRVVGAGDKKVPTSQILLTKSGLTLLVCESYHSDIERFLVNPKPRRIIDVENDITYTAVAGYGTARPEIPSSLIEGAFGMVIQETPTPK